MTRQNQIPTEDGSRVTLALIPLWDMCNHTNGLVRPLSHSHTLAYIINWWRILLTSFTRNFDLTGHNLHTRLTKVSSKCYTVLVLSSRGMLFWFGGSISAVPDVLYSMVNDRLSSCIGAFREHTIASCAYHSRLHALWAVLEPPKWDGRLRWEINQYLVIQHTLRGERLFRVISSY